MTEQILENALNKMYTNKCEAFKSSNKNGDKFSDPKMVLNNVIIAKKRLKICIFHNSSSETTPTIYSFDIQRQSTD